MQLARVIGTVVATVKNDSLAGRKLLVVQSVDRNLEASGKPMVAPRTHRQHSEAVDSIWARYRICFTTRSSSV